MIQIDDSNVKSIQEGIATLRKKENELRELDAKSNLQKYKDLYIGKWIKLLPRDLDTYEVKSDSSEFTIIKVKDVISASKLCSFQDSIEFVYEDGTYLKIDEDYDNAEKIQELDDWKSQTSGYSNCIEVIKPDILNRYIEILQNKVNKILNAK